MGCPKSCMSCPFDYKCNSSMYAPGCHFYPFTKAEKVTVVSRIKALFGKIFN